MYDTANLIVFEMKKFIALLALAAIAVGVTNAADRVVRDVNVLPAAARKTIDKAYSVKNVSHIKIDSHFFGGDDYDVVLTDGTEIEFNSDGEWTEVDAGSKPVSATFILKPIAAYVKANYANQSIVQIKKERSKYEVELSSGLDLEFDRAGNFLRIDD